MAWNSWNHFACDISEDLIKQTVDSLVSLGLKDLGYNYVNLDDCWQAAERDESGRVVPDSKRFPSGMKALGEYIHSKGLKFGIYSSAGFKTCQAFPASLGLEELDAAAYKEWGVDYLKYDNCFTDHGTPYQRYPPMGQALDATGRDIVYSLCEWGRENPAVWAAPIANVWRISGDIYDGWSSILTRAAIDAPLWRYAGPGGWNDPDMLEVGNGKCTDDEYKYHFAQWAMLKAPLIIGNDIRQMAKDSAAYQILSNAEIIAVNQDPLGRQARRVWSDTVQFQRGDRLIATKCSSGVKGAYEDAAEDQQWRLQADGTIQSASTGRCLLELTPERNQNVTVSPLDVSFGLFGVVAADCATATRWLPREYQGGSVVSATTGRCLEVSKFELEPLIQGKRIQTGKCHAVSKKVYVDVHEHQSWTSPAGTLRNLYQRQCLTVDRDAPAGIMHEVWTAPLADGSVAVMLANKGPVEAVLTVTWDMLGWNSKSVAKGRNLWTHEDLPVPVSGQLSLPVKSHNAAMIRLTPARA